MRGNTTTTAGKQGLCKLHNARFYNISPRGISSMAYNPDMSWLAISRDDATIEIWNIQYAPFLEQTIAGSSIASIEAIAWCENRLFTTGLTGELIEWDLRLQQPRRKLLLTGNAAWCMDISRQKTHLIAGTNSGFVNVYDLSDDEVNFVKVFDKQDGKILCCKFDHSGEFVATGSADTIRLWELKTGHAIYKMTVGRNEAKKETIVWSIQVLKELVIVAGDSRGYITVWDGKIGAQIDSFQAIARSDVLSVAVNDDETMLACAGINPKIRIFALTEIKKGDSMVKNWVKFIQRSVHEHDVKALQFVGEKILSGGVDGYLGVCYSTKVKGTNIIDRFGPFLEAPNSVLAPEKRVILLKYSNYIELWRLGLPGENTQLIDDEHERRKYLTLQENLSKLLEFRSMDDALIVCTTISPNAEYLTYSTEDEIRFFQLTYEDRKIAQMQRIKVLPEQYTASRHCLFSADSKQLFLFKRNLTVDIFRILKHDNDTVDIAYETNIDLNRSLKGPIGHIRLSHCGEYLVCADVCCNIAVWRFSNDSWSHYINLPKYSISPVAIAIHDNAPKLVAAFSDGKIFEYHLEEMRFSCTTATYFVDNQERYAIKNIALDPRNENIFIAHNDTFIFVLKKENGKSHDQNGTKRAKVNDDDDEEESIATLTCTKRIANEHLIDLAWLDDSEMVAVGVNPVTLIAQLPPSLKEKHFGVS